MPFPNCKLYCEACDCETEHRFFKLWWCWTCTHCGKMRLGPTHQQQSERAA